MMKDQKPPEVDLRPPSRLARAASQEIPDVMEQLDARPEGLSSEEARRRLTAIGPNALRAHRARPLRVLGRQLKSPILVLLFVTATVSVFLGEATNSVIIGVILAASIGLGFVNEFRAEQAADALHDQITHTAAVIRDGAATTIGVTEVVPGDIVRLSIGAVVPADMRLIDTHDLSCDEGILTGESLPVAKSLAVVSGEAAIAELHCCVLMGTVVLSGAATAVVVDTGPRTQFGRIAVALGAQQPQTEFQRGLGRFSLLLLEVAVALTTVIFVVNVLLHRPVIDSLLFSLAIAVGITPQLLPAVVSASLATGSRALAKQRVLVKRLVCIEDLGDMDVLVTDKTGTLTEGRISLTTVLPIGSAVTQEQLLLLGLLATEADYTVRPVSTSGLNALDAALWESPQAAATSTTGAPHIDVLPFDHDRRRTTVLVDVPHDGRMIVTKGAPEDVLAICVDIPAEAQGVLDQEYAEGGRVVAVAHAMATDRDHLRPEDESGLTLDGLLVFLDRPKSDARQALDALAALGVSVKIATGDNALVAQKVLSDIGLASGGTLIGTTIETMDDDALREAAATATIFARVSPEQKARVIRVLRRSGRSVAFLGDGVNDALALHQADIGISVETAADVAKDAADVLLLDKDLGVLAAGVMEGRRIFANTIKYVLMGASSNFGNMFSASVASLTLPFLPMTPGQILLNNLLYDTGQLAIPGDHVDPEQLLTPSHWDIGYIRRFMLLFGSISSVFDFATFALMLFVFHAGQSEFQSGWFIESIATQTLIIFAIRTRRVPFFRSRPSLGLALASFGVVGVGVWLPYSPLSRILGFHPLPFPFFLVLVAMVVAYLVLVEIAKARFFSGPAQQPGAADAPARRRGYHHRVSRRAARFTTRSPRTRSG
ncbi:Mg2+-importing ATPase [Sanguibacter gelidistatuariae]|uniref:Magnesium-transporting ATPase, P-type 1 n=1 Tax=Sanguibacter gelidistatuariae TaxID=1814289 RepID=A0A1G6K1L8_9MICO|nr:Mg2+-importing ATPase [Sanguibacter gelidistatuariae]